MNRTVEHGGKALVENSCVIKAGALVIVCKGYGEDYGVVGLVRALADLDTLALAREWEDEKECRREYPAIIGWLESRGLVKAQDSVEWDLYVGD